MSHPRPPSSPLGFGIASSLLKVALCVAGCAIQVPARADSVILQQSYYDEFQFAGLYAAQFHGIFAKHGFDVELKPINKSKIGPIEDVLEGRANYGISMGPHLLSERLKGRELVMVAPIMQHSPMVLITRASDGLRTPQDLIGRRVALDSLSIASEIRLMFEREGISLSRMVVVPDQYGHVEIQEGSADAESIFVTDAPFVIERSGLKLHIIRPIDYGVDYYGDCLFTREDTLRNKPEQVAAMRAAVLEGWDYALHHVDETIDWILAHKPNRPPGMDREALEAEARQLAKLINADLVSLGHSNAGRWQTMASEMKRYDTNLRLERLDGFVFELEPKASPWNRWLALGVGSAVLVAGFTAMANRRLHNLVRERSRQLLEAERETHEALSKISNNLADSAVYQVECAPDGQRKFRYVGESVQRLFGLSAESALKDPQTMYRLIPDEDLPALRAAQETAFRNLTRLDATVPFRLQNGSQRWVRMSSTPRKLSDGTVVFDGILTDITVARQQEERLRQVEKMNAIGRLSSGLAHDFNNLLTVITGNVSLLNDCKEMNTEARESITEIREAATRAGNLTRQLLAFSRQQPVKLRKVDLNAVISGMISMLDRLLGETVTIKLGLSPDPLWVMAEPSMLEQVALNLAVNARDAMAGRGVVTIETSPITFDEVTAAQVDQGNAGTFACLSVADTGAGIPADILPKIFDPFFTTKEVGKGTGLGLATVYGIAKQHAGWVSAYSDVGVGTTVRVYLPLSPKSPEEAAGKGPKAATPRGGETLLLVEDEALVRNMTRNLLTSLGYQVIEANSGKSALELWASMKQPVDLVLTDLVMPDGLSGVDLARALRKDLPCLKVVFMSGYSPLASGVNSPIHEGSGFLAKPFDRVSLAHTIRSALDAGAG